MNIPNLDSKPINMSEDSNDVDYDDDDEEEEEVEVESNENEEEEEESMVDFNFDPIDLHVVENENENNIVKKEQPNNREGVFTMMPTKENIHTTEEENKYATLFKNKVKNNFERIFLPHRKYVNTKNKAMNLTSNFHNNSTQKTVFTKVSEDFYNKQVKTGQFTPAYDYLVNDQYLNRVSEKNDSEFHAKQKSFLERNKEYENKKTLKVVKSSRTGITRISSNMISSRTTRKKSPIQIRSPEKYLEDQLKFIENKENNLKLIRESIRKINDDQMQKKPEISEASKLLAKNRNKENKDIHTRLYEENAFKKKLDIIDNNRSLSATSEIKKKSMTEKEAVVLYEKLYNDASERRKRKDSYESDENRSRSGSVDLTTNSSKLVILKKFIREYEVILLNLFKDINININSWANIEYTISYDEYCDLLYAHGFVNYDHRKARQILMGRTTTEEENSQSNIKIISHDVIFPNTYSHNHEMFTTENNNNYNEYNMNTLPAALNDENVLMKLDKELILIKDSWRVLTKQKSVDGTEKVDLNQIFIFFLTTLGIYKGEVDLNSIDNNNNSNSFNNRKESKNQNQNEIYKKSNSFNSFNSVHRRSLNTIKTPSIELKRNIINDALPTLDMNKYGYVETTANQIRVFFRIFYDNRYNMLIRQKEERFSMKVQSIYNNPDLTFSPKMSMSSIKSADEKRNRYQSKVLDDEFLKGSIRSTYGEAGDHFLKMSNIYEMMKLRKEKYNYIY